MLFDHINITAPEAPGVITPSAMPGVIVEPLFLTNDWDAAVIASA